MPIVTTEQPELTQLQQTLRQVIAKARRCENLAAQWKHQSGADNKQRECELARAEAYRDVVLLLAEDLNLNLRDFWPNC